MTVDRVVNDGGEIFVHTTWHGGSKNEQMKGSYRPEALQKA